MKIFKQLMRDGSFALKKRTLEFKYRNEINALKDALIESGGGDKCSVFASPAIDGNNYAVIALNVNSPEKDLRFTFVPLEPSDTLSERTISRLEEAGINWKTFCVQVK
jgi:hypothetical protein